MYFYNSLLNKPREKLNIMVTLILTQVPGTAVTFEWSMTSRKDLWYLKDLDIFEPRKF